MNTIAGIERYAASAGDVGMFITLTTPSKYHPTRQVGKGESKTVQLNHGWNETAFTPKDGQRYQCRIWSLMRTAFKDNDLEVYGMRVVEPHHDGTPHWHMMLFCKPGQRKAINEIMRRYALKEDGHERVRQNSALSHVILIRAARRVISLNTLPKISTVTRSTVSSTRHRQAPERYGRSPSPHGRLHGASRSLNHWPPYDGRLPRTAQAAARREYRQ